MVSRISPAWRCRNYSKAGREAHVLSRAGMAGLQAMQQGACEVLAAGGCASFAGRAALARLDAIMLALNASPGGAADLLAATLFLDRVAG